MGSMPPTAPMSTGAVSEAGSHDRVWLERRPLGPGVKPFDWKAFLDQYFAAARRMIAPYRHVRLTMFERRSTTDGEGRTLLDTSEIRLLRSGEFASLRFDRSGDHQAYLAHPWRSILARRDAPDHAWEVEDQSKRTPEQSHHVAMERIEDFVAGELTPLVALSRTYLDFGLPRNLTVTRLEHFEENGRPRVLVRIEDPAPVAGGPWRAATYILAADDLYALQSERLEGLGPDKTTEQREFTYDRHEGIPVLRSVHTAGGSHPAYELKVVERRFGPIPEEEFHPDRFLDGPQAKAHVVDPDADEPSLLARTYGLPLIVGAICLIGGAAVSWPGSFKRCDPTSDK